jgi:hypothetical protein
LLNRVITLGATGLPAAVVVTAPASEFSVLPRQDTDLLCADGIRLELYPSAGSPPILLSATGPPATRLDGPGHASWFVVSTAVVGTATITVNVSMTLSLEGYMEGKLTLSSAPTQTNLDDVRLVISVGALHGLMRMGMDEEALPVQAAPPITWRWGAPVHMSSAVWVGSTAAGIRLHLKGDSPFWDSPAPNPALISPPAEWGALNGTGGCNVTASAGGAVITAFTGQQQLGASKLSLHFDLTVTPFHAANQTEHWGLRHFQVCATPA